jgi:hypothetical protein
MENNVPGRKSDSRPSAAVPKRGRGRPRQWSDDRQRRAAYRARTQEWTQQLEALYVAMINARWDEPEVQRTVDQAEDTEVVRVLIDYFQRRHRTRPG